VRFLRTVKKNIERRSDLLRAQQQRGPSNLFIC